MFKTNKKIQNKSLKRSIDIIESTCLASNAADRVAAQASSAQWTQTYEDLSHQIEVERKRGLGIMYSRNTFG